MVRLHEYQGKILLKTVNISIPEGEVAFTPHEARKIAERKRILVFTKKKKGKI